MSGFEIREATAADAAGIRRLFERVFGHPLSEEQWRWKFEQNPDGWRATVGVPTARSSATTRAGARSFVLAGEPTLLYSVGDVATDPSVRALGGRRGVYREMTNAFYAGIAGLVPFCYGFPNARALRVSERIVGSRTLFPVEIASVPVERFGPPPADVETGDSVDESFDALWREAARAWTTPRSAIAFASTGGSTPGRTATTAWSGAGAAGDDGLGGALGGRRDGHGRGLSRRRAIRLRPAAAVRRRGGRGAAAGRAPGRLLDPAGRAGPGTDRGARRRAPRTPASP